MTQDASNDTPVSSRTRIATSARIAPGVVIHVGCKVFGAQTSIGPHCVLGREAPATVEP